MKATGAAGWVVLSAAALLLPQIAASAAGALGLRRLLIHLLGISYHSLRLVMPSGAKKAL